VKIAESIDLIRQMTSQQIAVSEHEDGTVDLQRYCGVLRFGLEATLDVLETLVEAIQDSDRDNDWLEEIEWHIAYHESEWHEEEYDDDEHEEEELSAPVA
jgi:hypothetical protein